MSSKLWQNKNEQGRTKVLKEISPSEPEHKPHMDCRGVNIALRYQILAPNYLKSVLALASVIVSLHSGGRTPRICDLPDKGDAPTGLQPERGLLGIRVCGLRSQCGCSL